MSAFEIFKNDIMNSIKAKNPDLTEDELFLEFHRVWCTEKDINDKLSFRAKKEIGLVDDEKLQKEIDDQLQLSLDYDLNTIHSPKKNTALIFVFDDYSNTKINQLVIEKGKFFDRGMTTENVITYGKIYRIHKRFLKKRRNEYRKRPIKIQLNDTDELVEAEYFTNV
jgi:hypothetical protein